MLFVGPFARNKEAASETPQPSGIGETRTSGTDVDSGATDPIRFILNHESLTEEFCYMNRSGPYEWLGGTPESGQGMLQHAAAASS